MLCYASVILTSGDQSNELIAQIGKNHLQVWVIHFHMTTEYRVFSQPLKFCSQKWPDRHSWTKYFRNMVQPSRHGIVWIMVSGWLGHRGKHIRFTRITKWRQKNASECEQDPVKIIMQDLITVCLRHCQDWIRNTEGRGEELEFPWPNETGMKIDQYYTDGELKEHDLLSRGAMQGGGAIATI